MTMLITLCTNVIVFLSFQVDKKQIHFLTDYHNSAENIRAIKYVTKLMSTFRLIL